MIYQEEAQNSKCFVVSSCGFDSIPADLGTIFVQQKLPVPSSVEAFHSFQTSGNKFSKDHMHSSITNQMTCVPGVAVHGLHAKLQL